jgi:hypothetical protein
MKSYNAAEVTIHYYGGGTSNNASKAWLETSKTFEGLIEESSKTIYNVQWQVLQLGDFFHIDNLMVTHSSLAALRDTTKGDHEQFHHHHHHHHHHHQVLQTLHDIHKHVTELNVNQHWTT